MEFEFGMAWGMVAFLISIIVVAGSVVALIFRRMQQRLKAGG